MTFVDPVLTYQDESELAQLVDLYKQRGPKRVLEIGTAYGGTLYHWLKEAAPGTTVVSVDFQRPETAAPALWRSWVPPDVTLHLIVGDSRLYVTLFDVMEIHRNYDFIFIDGGHDFETVNSDWNMYGTLAAGGGLVVFDDIKPNDQSGEPCNVDQVWNAVKASGRRTVEFISHPEIQGNGIGVLFT